MFHSCAIGDEGSDTRERSDQVLDFVIRPALEKCGYCAVRADHISAPGLITHQVIEHILEDPLVIIDLTDRNPNVFYELAIRHAARKHFVQLIEKGQQIPFDVAETRTIQLNYKDLRSANAAKEELTRQIEHLQQSTEEVRTPISRAIDLKFLERSGDPQQKLLGDLAEKITSIQNALYNMQGLLTTRTKRVAQLDDKFATFGASTTIFERLTVDEMIRRESVHDGELQPSSSVYVNAFKPIEIAGRDYAQHMMKNIRSGVEYRHVFALQPGNGVHIANMIAKLACASDDERFFQLGDRNAYTKAIDHNVRELESKYTINLVEQGFGLEYWILNATHENYAHCYLRMPRLLGLEDEGPWIDWTSGYTACKIAEQVKALRLDLEEEQQQIIKSSKGCEFYKDPRLAGHRAQFMDELTNTIRRSVDSESASRLIRLCIGEVS